MNVGRRLGLWWLALALGSGGALTVYADDDHERARRLQAEGVILPLEQIMAKAQHAYPSSEVLEVEFEDKKDRLIYELEIVDQAGVVRELYFDARTAELIKDKRED